MSATPSVSRAGSAGPAGAPRTPTPPGSPGSGPAEAGRLGVGVKLAYGMPSFAGAAMTIPITVHLSIFYADTILLPLGLIAVVKAVARAFDAITDPVMGWVSDRTNTRWGRRRPWIAIGAPLTAICFVAMFAPPEALSTSGAALWFVASYVLYYLFHTVYTIPHYGLGPELTLDYRDRVSLFGFERAFTVPGTLVAAILPGVLQNHMSQRDAMFVFATIFAVLLTVLYLRLVLRVRERPDFATRQPNPLVPGVRRVMRNRVFRILLAKYLSGALTGAIPGTLMPFFTTYVLQPENPGRWVATYLAIYFGMGFVCLPAWIWSARRFGKKQAWLASMIPGATGASAAFFMDAGDLLPAAIAMAWAGTSFAAGMTISPSMQADVIDYDELHTGRRREAQFGSLWSVMTKFIVIPSMSLPLAIMAVYGYEPNVEQSDTVKFVIRALFGLAPAASGVIGFLIALLYPISEQVHREIWAGIEAHRRGEDARDPLSGRRIPPPGDRGVGEETGWFLDHFSPRELRRLLRGGPGTLVGSTLACAATSLVLCLVSTGLAFRAAGDLADDPGLLAVLYVVAAGFALTAFCFHAIRVRAARRLAQRPVGSEIVSKHLAMTARLSGRRTGVPRE